MFSTLAAACWACALAFGMVSAVAMAAPVRSRVLPTTIAEIMRTNPLYILHSYRLSPLTEHRDHRIEFAPRARSARNFTLRQRFFDKRRQPAVRSPERVTLNQAPQPFPHF